MAERSLNAQIEEVQYELKMRAQVYPGLEAKNRSRASELDEHLLRMGCVLETLKWLKANEERIKTALAD